MRRNIFALSLMALLTRRRRALPAAALIAVMPGIAAATGTADARRAHHNAAAAPAGAGRNDDDPLRKQFDSRPMGDLEGITSKVEYMTFEGKQAVYVTVNFLRVQGTIDGQDVTIERPIEFFIPGGQTSDGQQWITSSMRLLSMVGQSGGSVAKAVASMRKVVWDKGPVRFGMIERADGTVAPRKNAMGGFDDRNVRAQLLLQAPSRAALHRLLTPWLVQLESLPGNRQVRWSLDVDPIDLF